MSESLEAARAPWPGGRGEGEQSAGHPPRKGLGSILEALEASLFHPPALEALPEPLSPDDLQLPCHFQPKSLNG